MQSDISPLGLGLRLVDALPHIMWYNSSLALSKIFVSDILFSIEDAPHIFSEMSYRLSRILCFLATRVHKDLSVIRRYVSAPLRLIVSEGRFHSFRLMMECLSVTFISSRKKKRSRSLMVRPGGHVYSTLMFPLVMTAHSSSSHDSELRRDLPVVVSLLTRRSPQGREAQEPSIPFWFVFRFRSSKYI